MQGNSCIVLVNKQKHIFRAAFCRIFIALVAIFARWDRIVSLSIRRFGSAYAVIANPMRHMVHQFPYKKLLAEGCIFGKKTPKTYLNKGEYTI